MEVHKTDNGGVIVLMDKQEALFICAILGTTSTTQDIETAMRQKEENAPFYGGLQTCGELQTWTRANAPSFELYEALHRVTRK